MCGCAQGVEGLWVKARAVLGRRCLSQIGRPFDQKSSFGWDANQFVKPGIRKESSFCAFAQFSDVSGERGAPVYSLSEVATIFGCNCGEREAINRPICQRERRSLPATW